MPPFYCLTRFGMREEVRSQNGQLAKEQVPDRG